MGLWWTLWTVNWNLQQWIIRHFPVCSVVSPPNATRRVWWEAKTKSPQPQSYPRSQRQIWTQRTTEKWKWVHHYITVYKNLYLLLLYFLIVSCHCLLVQRLPKRSLAFQHSSQYFFPAASKEEKPEGKDLLADLQDISDSERKTSTAESSMGNNWSNLHFEQRPFYILQLIHSSVQCVV